MGGGTVRVQTSLLHPIHSVTNNTIFNITAVVSIAIIVSLIINIITTVSIFFFIVGFIIINTRPKPAYGRQGLASTFLVFSLRACGAQLQNNPTIKAIKNMKNHLEP